MPFIESDSNEVLLRSPLGQELPEAPIADRLLGRAFEQENTIVNAFAKATQAIHPPEPGYNPISIIKGTRYETDYLDEFVDDTSEAQTRERMGRIDREEENRAVLEAGGIPGMLAMGVAGIVDPTIFLPGSMAVRSVKGGYSILKSSAAVGAMAATGVGLQEGVLHSAQETRTLGESAINVGSATLLSMLLGGTAAGLLSRAEKRALTEALDRTRSQINLANAAGAASSDVRELNLRDFTGPFGRSVERLAEVAEEKVPKVGNAIATTLRAPGKLFSRASPTMTVFTSPSIQARRAMADLAETALEFEDNAAGIATSRGVPISRHVEIVRSRMRAQFQDEMDRLYKAYRFGDENVRLGKVKADLLKLAGRGEGMLTFREFKQEVAVASRNGDKHAVPQVEEAARAYRRLVDEPIKQRAIAAKLFPEDMQAPLGDESHVLRAWSKPAIRANPSGFIQKVTDYYRRDQETKAAAQQRIGQLWTSLKDQNRKLKRLAGRIDTQIRRQEEVETRLSEREMEAERVGKRLDVLGERQFKAETEIAELREVLDALKSDLRSPEYRERLAELEAELRALERAEKQEQLSPEDMARIDREERDSILHGPMRRVANILIGKARAPKAISMLGYMAKHGGISERDAGGEIRALLGVTGRRDLRGIRKKTPPGLIRKDGKSLDQWVEEFHQEAPEAFGGSSEAFGTDLPTGQALLDYLAQDVAGNPPDWWLRQRLSDDDYEVLQASAAWSAALERAGVEVNSLDDVAAFMRGEGVGRTGADIDAIFAEMEASGSSIPISFERGEVEAQVAVRRETIQEIRKSIAEARARRDAVRGRASREGIRIQEAGISATAQRGRLGRLADQGRRAALKRELLEAALRLGEENANAIRANLEGEMLAWEGKTAKDAQSALRARDRQEAGRSEEARASGRRLRSADREVDRTVKRILASNRDLSEHELRALATETMNRIIATAETRLPYDVESPSAGFRSGEDTGPRRGSLIGRQFAIPSNEVQEFLINDIEELAARTIDTMVPDLLLIEKFGHVEMEPQFKAIQEEFAQLAQQAPSPKEADRILKQGARVENVMRGVLARVRNFYGYSPNATVRNLGRMARVARDFNYMADLGGGSISQINDMAGAVFRAGFQGAFSHGWLPFFKHMLTFGRGKTFGALKRQANGMGIGLETYLHSRGKSLGDLAEEVGETSRFERTMSAAAQGFSFLNLMGPMTDAMKVSTFGAVSNEILHAARAVSEGKATPKQVRQLAASSITPAMAQDIWRAANEPGGMEVMEGTMVPNSGAWSDQNAALAFEAAVWREVDIGVITPGQEKPLWLSDPILGLLGQFKSFIASANERILLANLQRRDAAALQGLVTSIGLGMLSYALYSVASGREISDRPQDWVKEGLSRSGVLGWIDEGNAMSAKLTRGSVDIYRLIGADKPLSRYASRSIAGAFLGPTLGKVEGLAQVMGSVATGEWTASDTRALRRLFAGQNLFYIRRLLDQVETEGNALFRIPERLN